MKAFSYMGKNYIRVIPAKGLFRSDMVHDVVNRGDVFAVEIGSQLLTIIPGKAQVEHFELQIQDAPRAITAEEVARLRQIALEIGKS